MFDFKTVLEGLWPENVFGGIDQEGDLAKLLEGITEDYQNAYDQVQAISKIRDPRLTDNLADLEREYGVVPNTSLSDAVRRQMLAHVVYQRPNTASWEHLQNALVNAGFTNLIVTPNNPVADPTVVGGDLLVNGNLYISQSPAYYMAAGSDIAYRGGNRAFNGYYLSETKTSKTYSVPTDVFSRWSWRYIFWVGGTASGFPTYPSVGTVIVDAQRETQLKNLILRYKPVFTWAMLKITFS